jgi:hypothetical protein
MQMTRLTGLAFVILLAATSLACTTAETTPSATVTTIDPGGARWFRLEWTDEPLRTEARRLNGYVVNTYGTTAQIQLLAQALDAGGQVVDQKVEYQIFPVPGFGRSYFSIGPLAAADHYQVTVWSAHFLQAPKIQ